MSETATTKINISQVGTVMVPVSDHDKALEFYVGKLGLEKRADIPFGDGERWVEVAPANAATTLALVLPRTGEATGIQTRVAFSSENIEADHASLRARGVDVDEEVMRIGDPVPPMFFLRDHEGNSFLMVQRG